MNNPLKRWKCDKAHLDAFFVELREHQPGSDIEVNVVEARKMDKLFEIHQVIVDARIAFTEHDQSALQALVLAIGDIKKSNGWMG